MTSPRILFGLLSPGFGGHTRTAVALAEVLRARGHLIEFLVRAEFASLSARDSLIRAAGFHAVPIDGSYAWSMHSSFRRNLEAVVRQGRYSVIHWFDFYDGVRAAAAVARDTGCAFVWTATSGGLPVDYYGLNRVVVFTREVAEDATRRSPATTVHVLPARIDFRALTAEVRARDRLRIRQRFDVADDELLVVRVARCAHVYLRSVCLGIALVSRLNREGRRAAFLHAGFVEDPAVAAEIRRCVDRANADAGRVVAHSITDDVTTGTPYAAAADVCIGSGRTAIEALALERPTFVAWGVRYLGLVDADGIQRIAETNFQGRQSARSTSDDDVVSEMYVALMRRLADEEAGLRASAACAAFVRERYSVEGAADAYERLYADRTVTVHGIARTLCNPAVLARELVYRLPAGVWQSRAMRWLRRQRASVGTSGAHD